MSAFDWYILLIIIGFFLIALEVFIIGGVLGVLGCVALLGAAAIGFNLFGVGGGVLSLLALMVGTSSLLFLWIKVFPNSPIGRKLTLHKSINEEKGNPENDDLLGSCGEATTDLRPGGLVRIDDRRVDVQAASGWIDKGSQVEVIRVEGIQITVKKIS
jgi:membrane-bound serine protease (ClpP class)